ncbi:MAG: peptide chain release factor N(5)-glutamine methyltransferase [Treponema sp.]|nr:peptide chain release factor N(5)-glutamine methyltransferase [Treponema sp.]
MIIREAYAQGSADLKFAGIKTPGLDASILLAYVLKINSTALVAEGTKKISDKHCEEFCSLVERRAGGECIAYITGKKEFRDLEFTVNKSVLVPRPDTETLVEVVLEIFSAKICEKPRTVLDLCTGSGAVAISLKHEMPELDVYATDISAEALKVAQFNETKLLGGNKIHFYLGDLFSALPKPAAYSLIVSNPPYIPSSEIQTLSAEVQNEPVLALDGGSSGLEIIKRIINEAPDYLEQGGVLALEADPRQMKEINILLDKSGYTSVKLYNDLSGSQRVITGKYEK